MRILHLLSQRPERTGSGIYLQAVIREAQSRGHENFLVSAIPDGPPPDLPMISGKNRIHVRFEGGDLPFPVVGMSDVMPYPSKRFSSLTGQEVAAYEAAFTARLKEAAECFAPEMIHSHHLWLMTAAARALFPETPMVCTCHGTDLRQFVNCPHLRKRVAPAVKRLDGVMALSRSQAEEIIRLLGIPREKIHVVGGGYDHRLFTPAKKPAPAPVEILYAGKFSRAKGVPWLLSTLAEIRDLPWRLHMAGSGTGKENAECLSAAAALGERVVVHGPLSHGALSALMKRCHIFALASFYEGLPLVLLEALASGCRIVTSALAGSSEVLAGTSAGFIELVELPPLETVDAPFRRDEPLLRDRLADALCRQIRAARIAPAIDPSEVGRITKSHTWPEVYGRIEAVYRAAAATDGPPALPRTDMKPS